MADNPFARFATPGVAVGANPFAQFGTSDGLRPALEGVVTPDTPDVVAQREFGIDITQPVATVRASIAALPDDKRSKALDLWASHFVESEGKTKTAGQTALSGVNNVLETVARGTPVGSWGDEIDAGLKSVAHKVTGGAMGAPYDEGVAYNRARHRKFDRENPKTSFGLKVVGGLATAPVSPSFGVGAGASMLSRMAAGGATGAGYGLFYGLGEGGDLGSADNIEEAAKGTLFGTGIGTAAPVVASGVGNLAKYAADKYKGIPGPLRQFDRRAVKQASDDMAADRLFQTNGAPPPTGYKTYNQHARALGPDGMLADMGDNLVGRMAGLANIPGASKTITRDALTARSAGAPERIATTTDRVIGPRQNLVQVGEDVTNATQRAAKPLYDQFNATPIKVSENLYGILDRSGKAGAIQAAQKKMAIDGFDPQDVFYKGHPNSGVNNAALNARFLDYTKRAIDDLAAAATPGSNDQRIYAKLARELRNEVDSILSPSDPAKSVWAQARALSGEGKQFSEALADGGKVFNPSVHPDQLVADLRGATAVEQAGTVYGARGQIRDVMGNARSRNNTAEQNMASAGRARDTLSSDYARQKLDTVLQQPVVASGAARGSMPMGYQRLGNGRTDELIARLDAEARFANTQHVATGNSVTAARQATIKDMGPLNGSQAASEAGRKGPVGIATELAWKLANASLGGHMDTRRAAKAVDMAKMLTAQGASRDQIATALMQFGVSRGMTARGRDAVTRLSRSILTSPRFAFIDGAAAEDVRAIPR